MASRSIRSLSFTSKGCCHEDVRVFLIPDRRTRRSRPELLEACAGTSGPAAQRLLRLARAADRSPCWSRRHGSTTIGLRPASIVIVRRRSVVLLTCAYRVVRTCMSSRPTSRGQARSCDSCQPRQVMSQDIPDARTHGLCVRAFVISERSRVAVRWAGGRGRGRWVSWRRRSPVAALTTRTC